MSPRSFPIEFYNHPAAPLHIYHASSCNSAQSKEASDPRCNPLSIEFDPCFALQHRSLKYPCKKFPVYDNVAQFSALIWNDTGLNVSGLCQSHWTFTSWLERCLQLHRTALNEKLRRLESQRLHSELKQLAYQREVRKRTILKFREIILQLEQLINLLPPP